MTSEMGKATEVYVNEQRRVAAGFDQDFDAEMCKEDYQAGFRAAIEAAKAHKQDHLDFIRKVPDGFEYGVSNCGCVSITDLDKLLGEK